MKKFFFNHCSGSVSVWIILQEDFNLCVLAMVNTFSDKIFDNHLVFKELWQYFASFWT